MNDFDFDELDRAVSSVLSKTKPGEPANNDTNGAQTDAATPTNDTANPSLADDTHDALAEQPASGPETVHESYPESESPANDHDSDSETAQVDLTPLALDDVPTPAATPEEDIAANEPAHDQPEGTAEPAVDPSDSSESDMTDTNSEYQSESEAPSATAINRELPQLPTRRGRFMDVVSPGSTSASQSSAKPAPTHTTVTLQPSADFAQDSGNAMSSDEDNDSSPETADETSAVSTAEPAVEAEPPTTGTVSDDTAGQPQDDEPTDMAADDNSESTSPETAVSTETTEKDSTPFIPDVEVDKRPLNTLSSETSSPQNDDTKPATDEKQANTTSVEAPATVVTVAVPKEFNKEIMDVEANETVGSVPAPETASGSAPAAAPQAADIHHPMFDTSSLTPQSPAAAAHQSSKMTWIVIGTALFLVGAVLGVLYFLYGQS